ncbi:YjeF-related protein N-terminus-domain-containing protein [Apiosordaria backusii]|uniref:Enhancer of mRNA-decapping protein 3 n=1 Tax=Apiosordaria backusii TaxID=314023 RepID=A0AA40EI03_9PEZI|nr:YjeF-related protein N-terminus-domain-containing protein [Apiosordaria backusii]
MAAEFIGLQMMVTLRGNPPIKIRGTVSGVEAGNSLTLSNVWYVNTNEWKPTVSISASEIIDLVQYPLAPPPPVAPPPIVAQPETQPVAFIDPAIVAVRKRPSVTVNNLPEPHPQPNTSEKRDPGPIVIPVAQAPLLSGASRDATPTRVVAESLKQFSIQTQTAAIESDDDPVTATNTVLEYGQITTTAQRKKQRPPRKPRVNKSLAQEEVESSPQPAVKTAGKGKGWRQTPMLQSTASFQPFNSLKKATKGRPNADNGWASEDVTDVQEMGDFDFETGLAKFDKQNLFEQMRKEDVVDEADRLVSHNRLPRPKPGTAGGKNLHYSENVLNTPAITPTILKPPREKLIAKEPSNDFWNSEADDGMLNGSERLSDRATVMGSRQGSRRGDSKMTSSRRSQSRKATAVPMVAQPGGPSRVNSGVSHYHHRTSSLKGSRPSSRLSSRTAVGSGTAADKRKQLSTTATTSVHQPRQGLYVLPSNRRIETISALQMLNLENIAHNEIGLTEEMMTENAGRGLAEVVVGTVLDDPAIKVRLQASSVDVQTGVVPPPTVVVLAGNNKSGSRAVAAARHLRNKGINVLVCVVGLERGERDLLEEVRQQVRLYKNLGGRVFAKSDFFEHLRKISIPMLTIDTPRMSLGSLANPAPVMLIVDALLGLAISFEELRNGDQATVYELVEWANRNEAFVLAVDVPTGVDPSSGMVSVVDGNRLYVKPRYVVSMGAPKKGLLEAMVQADNEAEDDIAVAAAVPDSGEASLALDDAVSEWRLFLVDMGLGPAVWKKAGTKMRKGVDFGERWVLEMKYKGLGGGNSGPELDPEEGEI